MTKVAKDKKGARKLYTFSTPYSQTSDQPQPTQTEGNNMCDILGEAVTTDRHRIPQDKLTSRPNKHTRLPKKNTKGGETQMEYGKRKMTTSAIVVDGLGIAVHQKLVSVSVTHSPKKSRRVNVVDKKMMQLKVLGTILKMKHELDIIRERRLKLANKQRISSPAQEE